MSNVGTNKRTLLHIPNTHTHMHTQSPSWCSIMYSVSWTLLSHLNCLLQEFAHKINPQSIVSCHIQGCTFCLSIWLKRQNGSHNAPDTHCTRLVGRNLIIAHLRDEFVPFAWLNLLSTWLFRFPIPDDRKESKNLSDFSLSAINLPKAAPESLNHV